MDFVAVIFPGMCTNFFFKKHFFKYFSYPKFALSCPITLAQVLPTIHHKPLRHPTTAPSTERLKVPPPTEKN